MNNTTLKIAIIDLIGLPFDGLTLEKKGIGGSESAMISMAKELAQLGFSVTVLNDCVTEGAAPGNYQGVEYCPVQELANRDFQFDIVISQRCVTPFAPEHLWEHTARPHPWNFDPNIYKQLQRSTQLKILWLQDTFCWGDPVLEEMVTNGYIDEIFCLSDWHTSYTTHNQHGPRRNVEVLKDHIFQTRNAVNRWIDWVDIKEKDINHYVFNASVNKGMIPLLEKVWPEVRRQLPDAYLTVIGGYYQYPGADADDSVKRVWAFQEQFKRDPKVNFTGIITQSKIAEIVASAGWTIYPGVFPETSGISTLESITYCTPVLGCRFGALEESATELASYFIDYPVEPNGLFPSINSPSQIRKFIDMVVSAARNPYLYQQKQYACNRIREVATWDTVALQWKQHFYQQYDLELSAQELAKVKWINYRVHEVFGRRFSNPCEIDIPRITTSLADQLTQKNVKLAIVDIPGMSYDGSTLSRRGLGGSESAVILVSAELAKMGFSVTVFNGCDEDDSTPGVYDNVTYRPIHEIANDPCEFDVVISSRTVMPFITNQFYNVNLNLPRTYSYDLFTKLRNNAKLKIFWMHDTFSWGDDTIEPLVLSGAIDEIWCLSDFHSYYVMNCNHGSPRNYEVLRNHMWITRNGMTAYFDSVNVEDKDPDLFFFNANMSKGLAPLLNDVWPKVLERIPNAKLKIIGGFYKLGTAFNEPNSQETEFTKIVSPHMDNPSIEFTGVISQREVAEIAKEATFFIYPAALPETYGISCLESLYAQTPLITCRFGALEETATSASWMIDYAIVPNGLYPNIDPVAQTELFVDLVVEAHSNKQLLKEKQEECLAIRELASWNVVAREWKQHLFNKLNLNLSRSEFQQATYTVNQYRKLTGRRLSNSEQWVVPKLDAEKKIVVISPFYNAEQYLTNCINSVAAQDYDNYQHWLIDDCSTDNSYDVACAAIAQLPDSIRSKFNVIKNEVNQGAVYNQIVTLRNLNLDDDDIVMLLDGDDSLRNKNDIFDLYNFYHSSADFIYGSCWSMVDRIPLISQPYPPEVKEAKSYKQYKFNWNVPYTHLRTFKWSLLRDAADSEFQDTDGNWYKAGGDIAVFYRALEQADASRIKVVSDLVYNYNDINPLNDYKVNGTEQTNTAKSILKTDLVESTAPQPKKQFKQPIGIPTIKHNTSILIAIPTNRNIEAQTFKSIYDLEIPEGCTVTFQYFWGYQVEQVRNLIAHWVVNNNYDYLFAVDSDIAFEPDTLKKLLSHDKDIVTGIYIQRIPNTHCIEIMRKNQWGGVTHIPYDDIRGQGLVPIDGCGFGCVLVKSEVFRRIPYPQFVYKSAIDHANTLSEDVYFCNQARDYGFTLWADTSIICDHIGSWSFRVEEDVAISKKKEISKSDRLHELQRMKLFPANHRDYLIKMKNVLEIEPKVIYDIGACVLEWTECAKTHAWTDAQYYAFEAMETSEAIFLEANIPYNIGLLSDQDGKDIAFYENTYHPAGNSYYRENVEFSPAAATLFDDSHKVIKKSMTLDTVIKENGFPLPDLIKMDVQGAELDILKGAQHAISNCKDFILELQGVEYNTGAPLKEEVIEYMATLGFVLISPCFSGDIVQGDYHFTKDSW